MSQSSAAPSFSAELSHRIVALRRGNGLIIATGKMPVLIVTIFAGRLQRSTWIGLS